MSATVREVVRDVVAATAPHEVPLLDGLDAFDEDRVAALLARRKGGRDPLGFGVTEVAALVTPVVWLAVSEAVKRGTGAAVDGFAVRIRAALRRLFRRPASPRHVPPLSPEQLDVVHRRVRERAGAAGIESSAAESLADAVVSRLARESASGPKQPGDPPT